VRLSRTGDDYQRDQNDHLVSISATSADGSVDLEVFERGDERIAPRHLVTSTLREALRGRPFGILSVLRLDLVRLTRDCIAEVVRVTSDDAVELRLSTKRGDSRPASAWQEAHQPIGVNHLRRIHNLQPVATHNVCDEGFDLLLREAHANADARSASKGDQRIRRTLVLFTRWLEALRIEDARVREDVREAMAGSQRQSHLNSCWDETTGKLEFFDNATRHADHRRVEAPSLLHDVVERLQATNRLVRIQTILASDDRVQLGPNAT
jgi:hypothetical protein